MLITLYKKINNYYNLCFDNQLDKLFKKNFFLKKKIIFKNNEIILLEVVPDYFFLLYFFLILKNKRFKNYQIIGIWTEFPRERIYKLDSFLFLYIKIIIVIKNFLIKKKWISLYKLIGVNFVIDVYNQKFFISKNYNRELKRFENSINKKNFLINKLNFFDLIYDTFLRFKPTPTYEFSYDDKNILIELIKFTNTYINCLKKINMTYNVKYYLTSYATYLNHGTAVRFFINTSTKVFGGININQYLKLFGKNDIYHHGNWENYRNIFFNFKNKKIKLNKAKKDIFSKLSGVKVNSEYYLRGYNSYKKNHQKIYGEIKCIIFLPDLLDSPHGKGWFLFKDNYSWAKETLQYLSKFVSPAEIAVKPHPNSHSESRKFETRLKSEFKSFNWLNPTINNKEIFKKKPLIGLSPRGTVLIELAFYGIPSVCAGRSPFINYNFCYTPYSKSQYFKYLENYFTNKFINSTKIKKREVYEAYYMFALYNKDCFKNLAAKEKIKDLINYVVSNDEYLLKFKKILRKYKKE